MFDDVCNSFDRIPVCDRRHSPRYAYASRGKNMHILTAEVRPHFINRSENYHLSDDDRISQTDRQRAVFGRSSPSDCVCQTTTEFLRQTDSVFGRSSPSDCVC